MSDIVEFLRARLDEDESMLWRFSDLSKDRVLREVEAKRRIVDLSWHHLGGDDYGWGMEEAKQQVLCIMAAIYADHPDYRDEWR